MKSVAARLFDFGGVAMVIGLFKIDLFKDVTAKADILI